MSKRQLAPSPAQADFNFYRITPEGKAAASPEPARVHSPYLLDLLGLFEICGRGTRECELRQFMPPASLKASISTPLELGPIECDAPPPRSKSASLRYSVVFDRFTRAVDSP